VVVESAVAAADHHQLPAAVDSVDYAADVAVMTAGDDA